MVDIQDAEEAQRKLYQMKVVHLQECASKLRLSKKGWSFEQDDGAEFSENISLCLKNIQYAYRSKS